MTHDRYPRGEGTVRPFRLWNANLKAPVRWRYYSDKRRAHMGALYECRWAKIGTTIEVYDCTTGRLLGQYTLHPTTITYREA